VEDALAADFACVDGMSEVDWAAIYAARR